MSGQLTYEIDHSGVVREQIAMNLMEACEKRIRRDYDHGLFGQALPQSHRIRARLEGAERWHSITVTLQVDAKAKPDYNRG